LLRIDQLKVPPLPPLTFTVGDGECLVIEGPSGSGKTRLLRAIADLDPAPGHVFLNGVERGELTGPEWRKRVRYASAEPQWWTDTARPIFEAIDKTAPERLSRALLSLALPPAIIDKPLASLSTGERQRLALIRAMIDEPAILLLDEPVSALDLQSAALVAELLRFQMLAGRTLVIAAHNDNPVTRLAHARLQLARPAGAARSAANPPAGISARGGPQP
jgi:ABC-type iron transport system FetAB ATPase subunit